MFGFGFNTALMAKLSRSQNVKIHLTALQPVQMSYFSPMGFAFPRKSMGMENPLQAGKKHMSVTTI